MVESSSRKRGNTKRTKWSRSADISRKVEETKTRTVRHKLNTGIPPSGSKCVPSISILDQALQLAATLGSCYPCTICPDVLTPAAYTDCTACSPARLPQKAGLLSYSRKGTRTLRGGMRIKSLQEQYLTSLLPQGIILCETFSGFLATEFLCTRGSGCHGAEDDSRDTADGR